MRASKSPKPLKGKNPTGRPRVSPSVIFGPPRPVRFTAEEDRRLQETADRMGVPLSQLIRLCVRVVEPHKLADESCSLIATLRNRIKAEEAA